MDSRGGCCIARYSGNGGGGEINYGMSKVDKIMLKFRPIAPKPMSSGSGSGSSSSTVEKNGGSRRKRKYVRVNGNKTRNNKKMKNSVSETRETAVTLPLMPETPDRKENINKLQPILLSFNNSQQTDLYGHVVSVKDHKTPKKSEKVSFVTMECATETWLNGDVLGFTDQARVMSLEMDTCPSFITNCNDSVVWTNKAYREMTGCGGGGETVVVKKCNRVSMPVTRTAFTCKMKVTWGMESGSTPSTLTAPCDVVRLRSGGFAWRLDVNAALCLGR